MATIQASGTGRSARLLPHPAAKIWQALIRNAELGEHGALLRCPPARAARPSVATITAYDSNKTLECSWKGRPLRWELEPREGNTLVTLTHACGKIDSLRWLACLNGLN